MTQENSASGQESQAFQFSGSNNRPLIQGNTRYGPKREITLWINERATEDRAKAPDLRGHLLLTNDARQEVRMPVSGWFRQEDGKDPRIILQTDINHGNALLGSIKAMKTYLGNPADGGKGLHLIGDLNVPSPEGTFKLTISGEMNRFFLERDVVYDSARSLGFPEEMVQQFSSKLKENDVERARKAVDDASQQKQNTPQP